MARTTPRVEDATLVDTMHTAQPIAVGTDTWYAWLAEATTFAFTGVSGRFTARKERRGRADGYWRAYRKCRGKVHSVYLGKSADLTLARLHAAAAALAHAAVPDQHAGNLQAGTRGAAPPTAHSASTLATDTVTLLMAAIDSSTLLSMEQPPAVIDVLLRFTAILGEAITAHAGVFRTSVDGVDAAFSSPRDAVAAALAAHQALRAEPGNALTPRHVRMVLHTGVVVEHAGAYIGRPVQWGRRLLAASHGGQVLVSHVTEEIIHDHLPADAVLRDLGTYALEDFGQAAHLFQLSAPDLPPAFPPLRSPARRPHNLPLPATPLIGREHEVAAVITALTSEPVRLITLTGPGGVGKTRLGLQAAADLRDAFADGVFLVDLAALQHPAFVVPAIARMLGVVDHGRQPLLTQLMDYLATKHLLLLLDNFEQVRDAAPHLAALLTGAPRVKLLVTSRAALHLQGEHEIPVAPLALPPHAPLPMDEVLAYAAVRLFTERAQAVKPDFAVTPDTVTSIVEICRRVDGLPLAIELAAARSKVFPPAVLSQRLERRLPLLTGGARDLPARQQTLRDTIDWSYQLLDPAAQTLFVRLAVFAGDFTLDAAESVCSEHESTHSASVIDGLTTLVDQSLLTVAETNHGVPRLAMLETVKEYAQERFPLREEASVLQQRHAAYYLHLAEQAGPALRGPDMQQWLDRLEADHANLRAALSWFLQQGAAERGAQLAAALVVFWDLRTHRREGLDWLTTILVHGAALSPHIRAKTLFAAGYLARALYERDAAITLLEESMALYEELHDERGYTAAVTDLGWTIASLGGDAQRATALLQDGLARYRTLRDQRGIAWALHGLGWVEQQHALGYQPGIAHALAGLGWVEAQPGNLAAARALHAESLVLRRALNDAHGVAWSLTGLGLVAAAQREYDAARTFEEERLAIERTLHNHYGTADALRMLGMIALRQGDGAAAQAWLVESLHLARAIGDTVFIARSLMGLGEVAHAKRDHPRATAMLHEALHGFRELGDQYRVARVYALLAQVALDAHDAGTAHTMATKSLQIARSMDEPLMIGACLAGLADGAARQNHALWAAHLWGAAERHAATPPALRMAVAPADRAQLVAAARMSLGAHAFNAAWAAGRVRSPEEVLLVLNTTLPNHAPESPRPAGLTPREWEVLLLIADGLSNKDIAARLVLSLATVKTYLSAIYEKLGVSSRTAAMRYVIDHHLR